MFDRQNLLLFVLAICVLNGIFSPYLKIAIPVTAVLMPELFPRTLEWILFWASIMLSSGTLLVSGIPAALYERALQVDANNPYAYLALARQSVDDGDGAAALEYLDQAELLLGAEGERSPRVEPHLAGLRGGALRESGNESRARPLLLDAAERAPGVWDDGRLDAAELR